MYVSAVSASECTSVPRPPGGKGGKMEIEF